MEDRRLVKLLDSCLKDNNLEDCFLIEMKTDNNKIEIFLDSDDSVTFTKCRVISRCLETILDEKKWFGEKYTLEVSSAGVGRPLQYPRQYRKNIGRLIQVKYDDQKIRGPLTFADDKEIKVEVEEIIKEGKKKKKITNTIVISYDNIREAKIKASF